MNVLSLFDGMSCGQIALNRLGHKINKYYASEIDKHAITVTKANYPNTIHLGDVTKWKEWDIDWSSIDLLLAGSPCQGFSFAGKQLAFDDPRSALFFVFVDIWKNIKKHNPKAHYLLENVRMKQDHEHVISRMMQVEPVVINSALLSAQNRVRLYWTNISNEQVGLFGFNQCMIPQPSEKGILLKDILEDKVDDKYFIKNPKWDFEGMDINGKNNTLRTGGSQSQSQSQKHNYDLIKIDKQGKPKKNQEKAGCLTGGGHSGGNHSDMDLIVTHSLQPRNGKGQGGKGHLSKTDQKTYCIDTGNSQAIEYTKNYVQWDVSGKGHKSQQDRAFYEDGKHGTLASARPETKNGVLIESRIRRLTPVECERLQTVPDNYTNHVSDTQRYKMLGNGWTVDVICHILKYIK